MARPIIFTLLPGVQLVIDPDKFTVESNLSLGGFSEGADIKVSVDIRLNDMLTKEQSKVENIATLRTK